MGQRGKGEGGREYQRESTDILHAYITGLYILVRVQCMFFTTRLGYWIYITRCTAYLYPYLYTHTYSCTYVYLHLFLNSVPQ